MNAERILIEEEVSEDEHEQFLTELYGTFMILQQEFDAGRIVRELDPIAFRESMADCAEFESKWICGECGEEYDEEDDAEDCCKDDDERGGL